MQSLSSVKGVLGTYRDCPSPYATGMQSLSIGIGSTGYVPRLPLSQYSDLNAIPLIGKGSTGYVPRLPLSICHWNAIPLHRYREYWVRTAIALVSICRSEERRVGT